MQKKRVGLDPNFSLPEDTSVSVPLEKAVISDKQISQAWDKLADKWANRFTEHGDMNRKYIIDPTLFRLMGKVKGLSILDAGCGHGYLCRLLAKKGANMVGVDLSKSFIEMARQKEKAAPLGITYYHRSLSDLAIFQNETFDMVVSNLALMDVLDQKKAIGELHRVLKKNGRLIFSIMHPCFSSSPVHGWVRVPKDSQRKEDWIYWKVDRYFDRSMEIWQLAPGWPSTYSFHYPLSDYVKTLIQNGFTITNFEEPVPSKKAMKEHHRELGNECDRIPWFLIIGAKKT